MNVWKLSERQSYGLLVGHQLFNGCGLLRLLHVTGLVVVNAFVLLNKSFISAEALVIQ